jgi:hypothetical protein
MTDSFNVDVNITPRSNTEKWIAGIKLVTSAAACAYTVITAWEVAKMICPPLIVHEMVLIAKLKRLFPAKPSVNPSHSDIEAIISETTAYVRELED